MTVRPRHAIESGLFVREFPRGARDAPTAPVLWIHGLGESGLSFERLLAGSAWRTRAHLVPDLPGYGRSTWPPRPLGLAEQADLLAGWLRARDEEPAVVVGHSMGGVAALLLAERHPRLVAAVVDVEGNKTRADCVFSGRAAGSDPAWFEESGFDALRDEIASRGESDPALRGYHVSLCLADPRQFLANAAELVGLSAEGTLARRLGGLACPRLYVAGHPRGVGGETRAALERAGVPCAVVDGAGHWPFLDRPDSFAAALRPVLDAA